MKTELVRFDPVKMFQDTDARKVYLLAGGRADGSPYICPTNELATQAGLIPLTYTGKPHPKRQFVVYLDSPE